MAFLYFGFLALLAWRNFRIALIFLIVLLPAYLIRLQIGPLPSTVLEITFGSIFFVWLIKYSREDLKKIWQMSKRHTVFFICFDLFFLASVISIFVSDMWWFSLGEWRAYFLEPMILFLILVGRQNNVRPRDLAWALALSTAGISGYSVVQWFTGWGITTTEWAAEASRRVTAFYTSPNAVGLYLGPIVWVMIMYVMISRARARDFSAEIKNQEKTWKYAGAAMLVILALVALFFTFSQGAWIGLAVGALIFLFVSGYKKIAIAAAIGGVVFSLFFSPLRQAVLFQDQAGQNRLRLWGYTQTFLTKSPKNFILGTGVRQFFRKVQKPYYDKQIMERLIYPHNIFLNFWTEVGLAGLLAITVILGNAFWLAYKIGRQNKIISAGLLAALTVILVHGLVDVPYFKNDLAFLFWIILVLPIILYEDIRQSQTERL